MTDVEEESKILRNFFRSKRHIFYSYVISSYPEVIEKLGIPFEEPFFYVERKLLSNLTESITTRIDSAVI